MSWTNRVAALRQSLRQLRVLVRAKKTRAIRDRWMALQKPALTGTRTCLLDFTQTALDGEQGRRFHALVSLLRRAQYDVYLVPRLGFLQSAHKGIKWSAVSATHPFDASVGPSKFDLCLTDRSNPAAPAEKTLRVSHHMQWRTDPQHIPLPYSFHPQIWDLNEDARLEEYRNQERKWLLFFGGNCQQKSYQKIDHYRWLETVNRYKLIAQALTHYPKRTTRLDDAKQLANAKTTNIDGFVLIDSGTHRLPAEQWMETLSQAHFFLAAPGVDYPLSHNCVETMAVGTIPVLEYGSLFTPALQDGVNCIAFSGRAGFQEALERVDSMQADEIAELRRGAIRYYEDHLSPAAFARELMREDARGVQFFSYQTSRAA
ncbi:glycosyltransferase family 47 protein [Stieleria varia]|uniref:Exostosin family protein n=1 Tax=Stieleria varia TaxID=2528005 RepID=A0A5C6AYF8_9BACT|nr:exostosin family protein [Stieleria varia]TWU04451.1 Exostosin family protein [Stieleria varia]